MPDAHDKEEPVPKQKATMVTFSCSGNSGPPGAGATILEAAKGIGVEIGQCLPLRQLPQL